MNTSSEIWISVLAENGSDQIRSLEPNNISLTVPIVAQLVVFMFSVYLLVTFFLVCLVWCSIVASVLVLLRMFAYCNWLGYFFCIPVCLLFFSMVLAINDLWLLHLLIFTPVFYWLTEARTQSYKTSFSC